MGKTVAGGYLLDTRAGPLELGFEVYPLDAGAAPLTAAPSDLAVGSSSGFRAFHTPEGDFGLTPSFQVRFDVVDLRLQLKSRDGTHLCVRRKKCQKIKILTVKL